MSSLAEFAILNGTDNRPPMLDKLMYDSWKSIKELYMENHENERELLKQSAPEKLQYEADVKATNIILQGVPTDVYALVSHHRAKGLIPFKTVEQKLARKNELKAKNTLMLAIPDEHLLKFHACKDAKSLWEAIKNSQEGLDKTYDRFQNLISQLEIHVEVISQEDANLKLLRSLPSAWNNIALIIRNKSDLDTLSMDDLYANLEVSKDQASTASYADDVIFSFFANQSNAPQLENEDLEQINADDLEEIDLKWQVAMLTMRVKRFIKKIGRNLDLNGKETVGFDKTNVKCYNYHRRSHFVRECRVLRNQGNRNRDDPRRNAPAEEGIINFALMAYTSQGSSSSSSSDFEVHTCSKDCLKSYEALQKPYDQQSEALNKSNLEIIESNYESELNNIHMNESEVVHSVFNSKESDVDDNPVNDRLKTDESVFKSAVRKTTTSILKLETSISNTYVFRPKSDQTKPKFTKINFVKSGENMKSVNKENTHRQSSMLKVPRNKTPGNSFDLKNVVPSGGSGPDWLFDIDLLTNSMNYKPVTAGNQTNVNAGIKDNVDAVPTEQYILQPLFSNSPQSSENAVADDAGKKTTEEPANKGEINGQEKEGGASNKEGDQNVQDLRAELDKLLVQQKEEADLNNLETTMNVSPIPTTRIHKDHPKEQIIGDPLLAPQTRRMTKSSQEHAMFRLQKVWRLVDLPKGKHAIGTKWVYRNKKDKRGIVVRNKARLVAQDPHSPEQIYKVEKALYGLHQAPKAWYETLSTYLLENGFRRGTIDKTLFIKKDKGDILKSKDDGIFISQDKYMDYILKKIDFATVKTASTLIETNKALLKDEEAEDVDVHYTDH
ncbi:putative ribonuclease H-like domain-containing protein [Tanacetum coccineum]